MISKAPPPGVLRSGRACGCRGLLLVGVALVCFWGPTYAQELTRIRWALGAPQVDPLLAQTSVAQELGYFEEGGIEVEVTPLGGGGRSIPLVASGQAEIGYIGVEPLLKNASLGRDFGIVLIFNQNRDPIFRWVVKPESPLQSVAELKGKTIGTLSLAASSTFYAQGELASLGLDPDRDVEFIAVGGGPSSTALLVRGQIDALVQSDTILAAMEQTGARYRYLPETSYTDTYFQGGLFTSRAFLKTHRRELCAYVNGISRGVVFTLENPEAAIRIHWRLYPESKPGHLPEAEALEFSLRVLKSRMHKWDPEDESIKKHGSYSHEEWMQVAAHMGLEGKVTDEMVKRLYTNDLVDCANDFDPEAIRRQARAYR